MAGVLGSPAWLPWQQGASLVLAWALAGPNPDAARELLHSTAQSYGDSLTKLLAGRARLALGDGPEPDLHMWFAPYELPPSIRAQAIAALERISGQPVTHGEGLRDPSIYTMGNETGAYLAGEDVPWLAA